MAEEKASGIIASWIKAGLTSIAGLVGGAFLMYLTPLVNLAIKPAKPVANFAMQVQGTTVHFNNRSQNGSQGWWDFGDGSALEPYSEKQETISHTFPRPGSYTVKLSLQNLVGEESDRTITVNIGSSNDAPGDKVEIAEFAIEPKSPPGTLPAIYAVRAKLKHADTCVWDTGEKLKFVDSPGDTVHRWVTFKEPGKHLIRLAAKNGKDVVEKDQEINIDPNALVTTNNPLAPVSTGLATLKVTYEAVQVVQQAVQLNVPIRWSTSNNENVSPFAITQMLDNQWKDYRIISAELAHPADAHVRNLQKIEITPDRMKFILRGELVKSANFLTAKLTHPPHWTATVALLVEKRSEPTLVPMDEIPVQVIMPGDTIIPIQPLDSHWQMTKKVMHLELSDGPNRVWSRDDLPTNVVVTMQNRPMRVSAIEQAGRLVLRISDANARPVGN